MPSVELSWLNSVSGETSLTKSIVPSYFTMKSAMSMLLSIAVSLFCFTEYVAAQVNRPPLAVGLPPYISEPENTTIGTVLLVLNATDPDGDRLEFSTGTQETDKLVKLENCQDYTGGRTCNVTLKSALDSDNSPLQRSLYFVIKEVRTQPQGQSYQVAAQLMLFVSDINDNAPVFVGLPYRTTVREDAPVGSSVYTVSATDPDTGLGSRPVFSIKANIPANQADYEATFTMNATFGYITLRKKLDYETRSFYHFRVSVKDLGTPQCPGPQCVCDNGTDFCVDNPVDLFISVEDVQDTPPVFEKLPYISSVPEDAPVGYSVLQVTAVDGDRGATVPNAIEYSFTDGSHSNFSINTTTGVISVASQLDVDDEEVRNQGGLFIFNVTATEVSPDDGSTSSPPTTSASLADNSFGSDTQLVSITVTDVNDNIPEFNSPVYNATVAENTPNGVPITLTSIIEVSDVDQGLNSRFKVHLEKDGSAYSDFVTLPRSSQIIQGKSTITIVVQNSSVLDYETSHSISFRLVAKEYTEFNNSTRSSEATVNVQILDINDNNPKFSTTQTSYNVSEDAPVGHSITTIQADDIDSDAYGQITYSLESEGHSGEFSINSSSGAISVVAPLNREARASYTLAVIATDNPSAPVSERRRSRMTLDITVTDVNDHDPEWTQFIPAVSVRENEKVGTSVVDLRATDMDEGLNGEIEYSIALGTNGTSLFDVKKFDDRAELRVAMSLIGSSGSQLVTVVATDKGSPRRSASVNVMVTVVDMNLHRPVFIHPDESVYNVTSRFLPKVTVPEEVPIGSVITQIVAEDDDQGDNGRVWYYLMPAVNRDYEYFRLDRVTGNLTADKRLDREKQEVYEIQVRAEDNGQPTSLTKSLTMKVVLLDIDDNEPSFAGLGRPYEMRVKEEEEDAEVGMVVRPVDPDSNPNNSRICFYLYGGENVTRFQIDKNSGSLSIIGKFDQEETKYLDIVVKASSNCALSSASFPMNQPVSATAAAAAAAGGGAAAATAAAGAASVAAATGTNSDQPASYNQSDPSLLWVRVQVVDVNDNPPVFEDSSLSAGLIFDAEVGTEVVSLKNSVTDADTPGNSVHTFKLLSITPHLEQTEGLGLPREPFVVSVNGTVFTNTPFRSDMMGYFELKVQVSDKDGLNDTTDLRVYLISNLQRVKLVFDKLPNEVEELKHNLLRELSAVLGYDLIIDRIKTHTNPDGSRDPSKTDAFLHGRYKDTGEVVPASDLWRSFDFNQAAQAVLFRNSVIETKDLIEREPDNLEEELKRILAIVVVSLVVIVVALVLVLIHLVRMYRRRLRAATTMAYVSPKEQEMYEHPGTNKYYAAENPLFGKEIKQAVLEGDRTSQNSLDVNAVQDTEKSGEPLPPDEEQEMVLQISDSPQPTPSKIHNANHNAKLDQLMKAYDNSAFDAEEGDETEVMGKPAVGNGHYRSPSASYTTGTTSIPGLNEEVQEGVTRFADEILSRDSGYPDGPLQYNSTHLDYTDI